MKIVLQRVSQARVEAEGRILARIGRGLLLLVGIEKGDGEKELAWMAEKVLNLRIFPDGDNKMNLCIKEIGGEILSVSQFTLAGDVRKGRRPDFISAAEPELAKELYNRFNKMLAAEVPVQTGEFRAMMDVHLVNNGPVTLIIEKRSSSV